MGPDVVGRTMGGEVRPLAAAALAVTLLVVLAGDRSAAGRPCPAAVAFVIGDSQANGAVGVPARSTWVAQGLRAVGYDPYIAGASGTGYVAGSVVRGSGPEVGNYVDAYRDGDWRRPSHARLVVLEGSGNDAEAADATIRGNAERLISEVGADYPDADIVVLGPIGDGSGRRSEIARVLARVTGSAGLRFIDPSDWRTRYGLARHLAPDGVHFTQRGHDVTAPVFADALRTAGLAPSCP